MGRHSIGDEVSASLGLRVKDSGFRGQGQGLAYDAYGSGLRAQGFQFLDCWVEGLGFRENWRTTDPE